MIFWIICALVTAAGIAVLLRPLAQSRLNEAAPGRANIAIYKDQLDEIERDLDRGLVNREEATAARTEISRRLLAVADSDDVSSAVQVRGVPKSSHQWLAIAIAGTVVGLSLGCYLILGSPGLPGLPHAQRLKADVRTLPIGEMIARVEARLRANPDDARGWDVIAPIYLKRKDYVKAARAYQQAIRLNGESDRRLAQLAEAVLGATNGRVTNVVKTAYERLLALRPNYWPAHFWLAVGHEQRGESKAAEQAYRKLLARAELSPEMRQLLRERLAAVGSGDVAATAPNHQVGRGAAPSLAARQQMARLSPDERQKQIRSMVDGLASRLAADGGKLEDWQRLIRALTVLGDDAKAAAALGDARKAFATDAGKLAALNAFAGALGLKAAPAAD